MHGELVETKKGYAVETLFQTDDGGRYLHRRLANGFDGQPRLGEVRWAGHDTWTGIGFTVATEPLPDAEISEKLP